MTSVFYDVIRLEAVRGGSNMLIDLQKAILGAFWGICAPKNVVGHRFDPKKALPYVTTRVLSHCESKSIHGSFQQASPGKKLKREALYFTYFARRSLTADWHKFWVTCSSRGHSQLCKVLSQSVKGFGFCEGSKFDHSHCIAMSPLTLLELTFRCDITSTRPILCGRRKAKSLQARRRPLLESYE